MKSALALLLVSLLLGSSLLPGFGIGQSAKWAELVSHYQQHRQTDVHLGLYDFLVMHYGADSEHQKHPKHDHHNLPTVAHVLLAVTPNGARLEPINANSVHFLPKATFSHQADLYAFLSVFALINPPRA
jgi:hypothetical protein